jgi:hypothetical protein
MIRFFFVFPDLQLFGSKILHFVQNGTSAIPDLSKGASGFLFSSFAFIIYNLPFIINYASLR